MAVNTDSHEQEALKVLKVLKGARDVLSDPERWTQGALARTASNRPVDVDDHEAKCFCLFGAIAHVGVGLARSSDPTVTEDSDIAGSFVAAGLVFDAIREMENYTELSVVSWNDNPDRNHAEVVQLLDTAISDLESKIRQDVDTDIDQTR